MFSISRLSEELAPWAVELPEAEEAIDLEDLSGGEREQVYIAVRLALAELLTKDAGRRELVVLDDVLTFTDDEGLKRVLAILEEMRAHAQFLILTCHPERYKPLKGDAAEGASHSSQTPEASSTPGLLPGRPSTG